MKNRIPSPLALVAALTFALCASAIESARGQVALTPPAAVESSATNEMQEAFRASMRQMQQMQEQVRTLQRAIEEQRQQAEATARRNEENLGLRFGAIEKSLDDQKNALNEQRRSLDEQRQRELETSRTMMYVAGGFAIAGLVAILVTAWLQLRTVQRLTEVGTSLRLGAGIPFSMALNEGMAPGENLIALSKQRYLDEVQRLQHRVGEMERSGAPAAPPAGNGATNAELKSTDAPSPATGRPPASGPVSQVAALIGKGQTFLNLDQAEKALACFDEALALDPEHLDVLVKRGAALERLQRFDDAIAVYDRIIGLDGRQTTAYLLKGGVFNRMKRFNDALACYDQALKTQSQRKGA